MWTVLQCISFLASSWCSILSTGHIICFILSIDGLVYPLHYVSFSEVPQGEPLEDKSLGYSSESHIN